MRTHGPARYAVAIDWIAVNDEPAERDVAVMATLISVLLVADLYNHAPDVVAKHVVEVRKRRADG